MWEIYTLYMIKEDEKLAVSFYTDRSPVHLKNDGKTMLEDLDFDRYVILGMFDKEGREALSDYELLDKVEYQNRLKQEYENEQQTNKNDEVLALKDMLKKSLELNEKLTIENTEIKKEILLLKIGQL